MKTDKLLGGASGVLGVLFTLIVGLPFTLMLLFGEPVEPEIV